MINRGLSLLTTEVKGQNSSNLSSVKTLVMGHYSQLQQVDSWPEKRNFLMPFIYTEAIKWLGCKQMNKYINTIPEALPRSTLLQHHKPL